MSASRPVIQRTDFYRKQRPEIRLQLPASPRSSRAARRAPLFSDPAIFVFVAVIVVTAGVALLAATMLVATILTAIFAILLRGRFVATLFAAAEIVYASTSTHLTGVTGSSLSMTSPHGRGHFCPRGIE